MELRELAEQIVFGTTLADKLTSPAEITDDHPGPAIATPITPGRPGNLLFKPHATGKSEFPGVHRLEDPAERGKLLHFFANHELLAAELMALVLLKFPEAPTAFRRGVLQTLRDEQEHTRLYLERLRACGVEFGERPVSGYFWRCVAPMEHPLDYVAGLCLTFEQANLDFAGHYGRSLGAVGDADSARLLEKIYRDEIGHVAYGLKWFRRWKNPAESDWDAFCRTLKYPLSPARARGFALNVAGRRAAGLDPQFIAQLNVYSQSKGRTPGVFVFNPFAEGRFAEGKAFNPTKHQTQLARDLENLPQFLCRQDDIVLTGHKPSVEFLSGIKDAGFPLPEFLEIGADAGLFGRGRGPALQNLAARKLGALRPWAWGPDSFELLQPLFASVTGEARPAGKRFNPGLAQLYSKAWSANFLRQLISAGSPPWLCSEAEVGVVVRTETELRTAIAAIRARGHHRIVVKQAFGVAGSNALRLFEPEILETQWRWMLGGLSRNRELVVEPWLDRLQDFSAQLEMSAPGLKLCGFTGMVTDRRGQFLANYAEAHHHKRIPERVVSALAGPPNLAGALLEFYHEIFSRLEAALRAAEFLGPIGIDAFVYRDFTGAVRLKPVVEINPRYTMGRVLVELMRQTSQNRAGIFRLVGPVQLRAAGPADFAGYARALTEKFPLVMAAGPSPRIETGALCLNDPTTVQACLAVFQVGRALHPLLAAAGG